MNNQTTDLLSSEDRFQLAESLKLQGNLEQAINNYLLAIEKNPNRENYYYNLAEVLAKVERLDEAIDCLLKTIEINSNWFKPYYELGLIFEQQEELDRAVSSYEKSIRCNSNYACSYSHLGDIFSHKGDLDTAAKYYQQAIDVQSSDKSFWLYLKWGDTLLKKGEVAEAIRRYDRGNQINPSSVAAKIRLGDAYCKQKNWQQAIAIYQEALELDSCSHKANFGLAQALWKQGERQAAISAYYQALKINPNDAKTYQELQLCLVKESLVEVVELEIYFRALDSATADPEVYYDLGNKLTKKGLIESAVECYLKAIEIDPNFLQAYQSLKHVTLYQDNLAPVIQVYIDLISKDPFCLAAFKNLAHALSQQGKLDQAIALQQQAIYQQTKLNNADFINKYGSEKAIAQPDFIIIGAEKCGTSSLYNYISQHQQVLASLESKIHFFTYNFDKGLDWYRSHFPRIDRSCEYITGEVSNSYLSYYQNTSDKLFKLFPEVKLLTLLRNPVARSISHYQQLVRLGQENRSFAEVVSIEIAIFDGVENIWSIKQKYWKIGNGTIWHSLYVYFLQKWLNKFERTQILIIKSEDLLYNPAGIMNRVFEFLELPAHQLTECPALDSDDFYEGITDSMRSQLQEFFAPHNRKLEELLDCKFGW